MPATPFVENTVFEKEVLDLIKKVFVLNNVSYDPLDFVIIKVEQALTIPNGSQGNTIMYLAPLTTNKMYPNLELYYFRDDIDLILKPFNPYIVNADESLSVYQVLDNIKLSINNQVALTLNDFFDTYVVNDVDGSFVELHSQPKSLFYTGFSRVPVLTQSPSYRIVFDIVLVPKT